MHRVTIALSALVVVAASCGGSDTADPENVLADLDLTDAELACYADGYDARGLDMDTIMSTLADDLSATERQAVLDIGVECDGVQESAAETVTDEPATDESDDADDDTASDEQADDAADGEQENDTASDDDTDEPTARTYDDLPFLERAFVDGITESGGTEAAGICILDEFERAGIEIFDLAEFDAEQPSPEILSAIFACGDELIESDIFSGGGGGGDTADPADDLTAPVDTYGDDAELDALWDNCVAGDFIACDELWLTSPIGSGYESFGSTCGERTSAQFGQCESTLGDGDDSVIDTYGDSAFLDGLWDLCAGGDLASCDELWFESPFGSGYEAFGATCGEREESERFGNCDSDEPMSYGEDPVLDGLWDDCAAGDFVACDDLWLDSPIGSDYESFASTCGALSEEQYFGSCDSTFG
ncbi:MAG: hypothetical protein AAF081_04890 [Actinomycetota bacterium]